MLFLLLYQRDTQEQPVVLPHVLHFMHVPFRTKVKFPHSLQESPSKPFILASFILTERDVPRDTPVEEAPEFIATETASDTA